MDQWIKIVDQYKERAAQYQAATNAIRKKHSLSTAQHNLLRQSFSKKRAADTGLIKSLPKLQEWPADSFCSASKPPPIRKKP